MPNSSMALVESQASLHCESQAELYNIEMTLGNRIRAARTRLIPKLTQEQLGRKFGITLQAVSSWERDATIPDLDKIAKLAKILKVPSIYLLEGKGPPPEPDSLEVEIDQLPPGDRAVVRALVESLKKQRAGVA